MLSCNDFSRLVLTDLDFQIQIYMCWVCLSLSSSSLSITPSWVSFTDEERLVGNAVKNGFHSNPENTVFDAE